MVGGSWMFVMVVTGRALTVAAAVDACDWTTRHLELPHAYTSDHKETAELKSLP
jgi:hypothetical protein